VVAAMVAAHLKEIPMSKAKSKRKPASRANDSKTNRNGVRQTTGRKAAQSPPAVSSASKKAHIIAMLRAPGGTTIAAMARAAKWQPHSVRGFLAGVVRKKLGLTLISADGENGRVYRISDRTASATA
jgi:hypothetical protein